MIVAACLIGCGQRAEVKAPTKEVVQVPSETTLLVKPRPDSLKAGTAWLEVEALQGAIAKAKTGREKDSLRVALGRMLAEFREYRAAGVVYDSVVGSGHFTEEALFEGGKAFLMDEEYVPALRMLTAAQSAYPREAKDRDLELLIGYAYEGLKQYGEAQAAYEQLIMRNSPLEEHARFRLGVVYRKMGKRTVGNRILQGLASRGGAAGQLARAELATGRKKKEIKMPALPSPPDTSQEARLAGGFSYAKRLMKRGNYSGAIRSFQKVVKGGGSRGAEARYYVGRCYEFLGENELARAAYQQAQKDAPRSGIADDALWRAGLVSYKLGQYDSALRDWSQVLAGYPKSQFYEESAFWSGRCLEGKGEKAQALASYRKVEEEDPFHYYAFKARDRIAALDTTAEDPLGSDTLPTRTWLARWHPAIELDSARWIGILKRPNVKRGLALLQAGFLREGAMELAPLEQEYRTNPYILWQLGKAYGQSGAESRMIWCGRRILRIAPPAERPKVTQEVIAMMYPVRFPKVLREEGTKWKIDPAFVLGIIREESRFRSGDVSRSGARGLMQVMPKTGKKIARELGQEDFQTGDLFDPYLSLRFGTYYLSSVRQDVGAEKELIAAGYNAGPGAVRLWASERSSRDLPAFIEDIPYLETREYVKTVLGSTWTYEHRFNLLAKSMNP